MAFLCPVRIRRNKKKKPIDDESVRGPAPSMGRITGSASIETLVRVGIEKENGLSPESKMVVIHDFTPCVDDELEVKRGQVVHILYQENDWVYVISEETKEGFIPYSYTAPFGSQMAGLALNVKKKMPRDHSLVDQGGGRIRMTEQMMESDHNTTAATTNTTSISTMSGGKVNQGLEQSDSDSFQDSSLKLNVRSGGPSQSRSSSLLSESSSQPEIHPFFKDSHGRFIVLYSYHAQDENDLSVDRGQCVTVLNKDDPEWFWVLRADGQEGFVPAGFVYPLDAIQRQQTLTTSSSVPMTTAPPLSSSGGSGPSSLSPGNQQNFGGLGGPIQQPQGLPTPPPQSGPPQGIPPGPPSHTGDMRYSGTELVMLYDYKAQAPDDLSVRRGDWVYADLNNQTVDGWLWAYAPKTRKYGFIPKAYARPPAMTSL